VLMLGNGGVMRDKPITAVGRQLERGRFRAFLTAAGRRFEAGVEARQRARVGFRAEEWLFLRTSEEWGAPKRRRADRCRVPRTVRLFDGNHAAQSPNSPDKRVISADKELPGVMRSVPADERTEGGYPFAAHGRGHGASGSTSSLRGGGVWALQRRTQNARRRVAVGKPCGSFARVADRKTTWQAPKNNVLRAPDGPRGTERHWMDAGRSPPPAFRSISYDSGPR